MPSYRPLLVLAFTCVLASGCARPAPRTHEAAAERPRTISLEPFGAGTARRVAVVVGGDTLRFLFDTGGGVTAISPAVATEVGCTPGGRVVGFRMTGEQLRLPTCEGVSLSIGGVHVTTSAAVLDLDGAFGPDTPPLDGIVSLHTLGHLPLTLDLARNTLTVETPQTLTARTRTMTPLHVRRATGPGGAELTPYVAVRAEGATWWFMFDSGHGATTFVAPHVAAYLGLADSTGAADASVELAPGLRVGLPVEGKPGLIHDGILSGAVLARAVWALDLTRSEMWVGPVAPLFDHPNTADEAEAPPEGWYDLVLVDGGQRQPAVLHLARDAGGLTGRLRFVGTDRVFDLHDVRLDGAGLAFSLPMRRTYPFRITLDGPTGVGTWGDAARGGAVEVARR